MTKASEKISDFRPQRNNANQHNQRGMGLLQKSIEGDGFIGAMTAADDGEIIAGSARLEKSAEVFGVDAEPIVIETDGTRPIIVKRTDIENADDPRAKRLAIADNRVQEVDLQWDTDVLQGLNDFDDIDLGDWWSDKELTDLGVELDEPPVAPEPQTDRAEELREKWGVESGQLWRLGQHRLICGDCTDKAVVARVMGGEIGTGIHDVPYGMNLDTDYSDMPAFENKTKSKKWDKVIGDNEVFDPSHLLTREYKELFLFGADYYAEKIPDRNSGGWLVWDKRTEEKFDPSLGSNFELIWSKKKHKRELIRVLWTGVFGMQNQDVRKRQHPTQKPLGVIEWLIKKYGDETIEDFYLGSGTTLIACERLDRQCRAVEISPAYVAVALERWHEYTGELPELIED